MKRILSFDFFIAFAFCTAHSLLFLVMAFHTILLLAFLVNHPERNSPTTLSQPFFFQETKTREQELMTGIMMTRGDSSSLMASNIWYIQYHGTVDVQYRRLLKVSLIRTRDLLLLLLVMHEG